MKPRFPYIGILAVPVTNQNWPRGRPLTEIGRPHYRQLCDLSHILLAYGVCVLYDGWL
jgi:hypothetical protein